MKNKIFLILIILVIVVIIFRKYFNQMAIPFLKPIQEKTFKYFTWDEFDATAKMPEDKGKDIYVNSQGKQKLTGSGKKYMKAITVKMLDDARHIIEKEWNEVKPASERIVFEIESGVRTQHYNDSLNNSVKDSAHITGYASDIVFRGYSDEQHRVMLDALRRVGFDRFGLGGAVHVDNDPTKPKNTVWYYANNPVKTNPLTLNIA